jgi:DNA-binding NtrC family response regulator
MNEMRIGDPERPVTSTTPRKEGVTRVLVVDDDEDVLASLQQGLSNLGYEVEVAASGTDALVLLEDEHASFDVAVVDLMLPDTWGPQMAVVHSQLQPNLKVVYISGHAGDDAVLRATSSQSGDVAFLSKPFELDDLVRLIRKQMGLSSEPS